MSEDTRVVIAGAGIGGLACAIALQHAGVEVVVLERAPELVEVGAGLGLMPNAVRVLEGLGLADELRRIGPPVRRGGLRRPDGRWLQDLPAGAFEQRYGAPLVNVHRADLQSLLLDAVVPGTVRLGAQVTGAEQDDDGVDVQLADGDRLRSRILVGADGVHSVVRRIAFGHEPLRYRGYTAWRCVVGFPDPGISFETWGRGQRFGAAAVGGGRTMWFASANAPSNGFDGDARRELLDRFAGWHDPIPALIEAAADAPIVRSDVSDRAPAPRWTDHRITLLGDAAHPMTPDLAQGACQALEDAQVLASCLAQTRDDRTALTAYEHRRRPQANRVVRMSRLMGRAGQIRGRTSHRLRDAMLTALPEWLLLAQLDAVIGRDPQVDTMRRRSDALRANGARR